MISAGDDQIKDVFVGNMGIKEIIIGNEVIHIRPGGYLYIELDTKEE